LGEERHEKGNLRQAMKYYGSALDLLTKVVHERPDDDRARNYLGIALSDMSAVLMAHGNLKGAEKHFRQATASHAKLVQRGASADYQYPLMIMYVNLAEVQRRRKNGVAAARNIRRALELGTRLLRHYPNEPFHLLNLANTYSAEDDLFQDNGQKDKAEQAYRKALEIREKTGAEFPKGPSGKRALADSYWELALLLAGAGRGPESQELAGSCPTWP
jgi:tetratricopeptide (TPR) repeat protein